MNKYLLLRDNKQTGPYSVDELINMGLKPYDLVWLDGKSAAWRYPSEIAELQAFAPAVEEQPYDRFYKKKSVTTTQQQVNAISQQASVQTEAIVVTTPVATTPVTPTITAKKIYVTLPAGTKDRNITATTTNTSKAASPVPAATDTADTSTAELLNEKFARLREEKMKQAESMAANPIVHMKTVVETPPAPAFSEIVEKHYPQQEETLAPVIKQSNKSNRILMRSIAAACLVLGGIIIGLVISNSRQQKNNAELDLLVKQIQEREKRKEAATQNVIPPAPVNVPAESNTAPADEPANTTPADNKKENIGTPVHNKTENNPKEVLPPDALQQQGVKFIPAVVTNKPENKPVNREEVEQARKNIHQLVAVDANKYKTGVLGGISDLQLTISNNSLYPLDQVEVEVRYLGPEKRVVKTQLLLFNDVAPGEQKTVDAPRTNRGVTVDYVITRINSKALGLAHAGY
ncbi:DUF4339 domain-containing protein [Pseudoflavitalea sp. X16]|uniref:DUF4339 domain-containing protein n=1 Tax=Paraflavitalea devenefica TaxID=2716334 RepID=UPI0014201833|nr:DUF4339 domain-containing protein [Paraflavitalea devenefica]NII26865.1 DUF4339 domain-containing protein [Paraflavitalea devenefica]